MVHFSRNILAGVALTLIASTAFAASSSTPTRYVVDPALQKDSLSGLTKRVQHACVVTQARLQEQREAAFQKSCNCYATKSMKAFTADEIQEYRNTGVFNASARDKALNALDACGLKRPM